MKRKVLYCPNFLSVWNKKNKTPFGVLFLSCHNIVLSWPSSYSTDDSIERCLLDSSCESRHTSCIEIPAIWILHLRKEDKFICTICKKRWWAVRILTNRTTSVIVGAEWISGNRSVSTQSCSIDTSCRGTRGIKLFIEEKVVDHLCCRVQMRYSRDITTTLLVCSEARKESRYEYP